MGFLDLTNFDLSLTLFSENMELLQLPSTKEEEDDTTLANQTNPDLQINEADI